MLANNEPNGARAVVRVGSVELFRLGPASYLWTRYPRALVKTFQKFFKTAWTLPLALAGAFLLALARRGRALALLLAVPAYYLCVHSPLHMEPRYVLAMHYFFSVLIAAALFWFGARILGAARRVVPAKFRRQAHSS